MVLPSGYWQPQQPRGAEFPTRQAVSNFCPAAAKHLPEKFPPITDDEGNSAPADVEFGFLNGDLRLFQLRPFLESKMARGIDYLHQMEAQLQDTKSVTVDMNGVPGS